MTNCCICGRAIRKTGKNWIMTPNGIAHRKCPKDKPKLSEQDSKELASLKKKITFYAATQPRGFIAEHTMSYPRAMQMVKGMHGRGYSYSDIEYALEETVKECGGFFGMGAVDNRIDIIIAKRESIRNVQSKMIKVNSKKIKEEQIDLKSLIGGFEEDEW